MSDTAAVSDTKGMYYLMIHNNLLNINRLMIVLYRFGNDTL